MTSLPSIELRKAYAKTVEDLYRENPEHIYALEADLSSAMGTSGLKAIMGSHYLDVGIMEAHMIGTAAGINAVGGFCFVHSFGQFLTRRAMDQIFVSLAYAQLDACLIGSDAGVTAEHNGGTHMTFEDMGIMRGIPNIYLYDVCSATQLGHVVREAYRRGGLTYIRTQRKAAAVELYDTTTNFKDSGAQILRSGTDVTLLACGIEVPEALAAADLLAATGISAEVIDVFRIKPLDVDVIIPSVSKTGAVVTCENHSVINGLGSAVAELLSENLPTRLRRIGVKERFGQVGTTSYLLNDYQLDAAHIAKAAQKLSINR
ncbi:MAG: transketolase family protein [Propionibacteriaceae bacterium]